MGKGEGNDKGEGMRKVSVTNGKFVPRQSWTF